jgi:hypothetical protein
MVQPTADKGLAPAATVGYSTDAGFFASRYKQGGRTVYSLDLSPSEIIDTVKQPDPETPSPGNRAIRSAHADGFARYFRERSEWVSPSIMLRTANTFDFKELETSIDIGGIQFGWLTIPRRNLGDLHIVDGQHRILGMFRASNAITAELDKARSRLVNAGRVEGKGSIAEKEAMKVIAGLDMQRDRMAAERVNVQIFVEADEKAYRQIFYDVADNALGITASVRSRFDSRKIVHRSLSETTAHPLLKGRVDPEGDRMGPSSPYAMGAKHVAEIIRTTNVGLDGRVSRRQEDELKEADMVKQAKSYLDVVTEAFPQFQAMTAGQVMPAVLRKTSLLGSVLFVRVLGGAYYDLLKFHAFSPEMVEQFFEKLAPHIDAPVYEGSIWREHLPELFSDGAMAPNARRQDLKRLNDELVDWAIAKPAWLEQKPKPRPVVPVEGVYDLTEAEERQVDEVVARGKTK